MRHCLWLLTAELKYLYCSNHSIAVNNFNRFPRLGVRLCRWSKYLSMHGGACEPFHSIPVHRPLPQLWGHLKRFGWACSLSPQSLPWQLLTAPLPPAAPLFIPQLPGNQGEKTGDIQGSHSRFECEDFTEKLLLLPHDSCFLDSLSCVPYSFVYWSAAQCVFQGG